MNLKTIERKYGDVRLDGEDLYITLDPEEWGEVSMEDNVPEIKPEFLKALVKDVIQLTGIKYQHRILFDGLVNIHFYKLTGS